jgi:hypothetical protein
LIAPTVKGSTGNAEDFTIGGFNNNNSIILRNKDDTDIGGLTGSYQARSIYTGKNMTALIRAEVINLSRNIIITGKCLNLKF